jgi:hypothetical protein
VAVLHRIEMNVVDMARKIGLVPDRVFPISALPDSFFAPRDLTGARLSAGDQPAGKPALDEIPSQREIWITGR